MPRKVVPLVAHCPYHVCTRSINKEWFELDMPTVWQIMEDYLYFIVTAFEVDIHSFVLMSNHYHLLITAPRGNLSEALLYFQRETSRELSRLTNRINQTWGTRNHKTLIRGYHHFMNTYKYVYRNPVRAGICTTPEAYPYSTLRGIMGFERLIIPVVEDTILFTPEFDTAALAWLNLSTLPDLDEEMRRALRRPVFEPVTSRKTGRVSVLDSQLI